MDHWIIGPIVSNNHLLLLELLVFANSREYCEDSFATVYNVMVYVKKMEGGNIQQFKQQLDDYLKQLDQ